MKVTLYPKPRISFSCFLGFWCLHFHITTILADSFLFCQTATFIVDNSGVLKFWWRTSILMLTPFLHIFFQENFQLFSLPGLFEPLDVGFVLLLAIWWMAVWWQVWNTWSISCISVQTGLMPWSPFLLKGLSLWWLITKSNVHGETRIQCILCFSTKGTQTDKSSSRKWWHQSCVLTEKYQWSPAAFQDGNSRFSLISNCPLGIFTLCSEVLVKISKEFDNTYAHTIFPAQMVAYMHGCWDSKNNHTAEELLTARSERSGQFLQQNNPYHTQNLNWWTFGENIHTPSVTGSDWSIYIWMHFHLTFQFPLLPTKYGGKTNIFLQREMKKKHIET